MQYHFGNMEKETTSSFCWKCYELSYVIPDTGTVSISVLNTSRHPFAYISFKYISAVIGLSCILLNLSIADIFVGVSALTSHTIH